jgi:hypothetical protein
MANALFSGQDGASCGLDLPDGGSEIFLVEELDRF